MWVTSTAGFDHMRKLLALLMGLNECASTVEIRKQYQRLNTLLLAAETESSYEHAWRYLTARERLSIAYEKAKRRLTQTDEMHGSVTGTGLLLGEILVDAEIITPMQLEEALATQAQSKPPLPLGRILVARKLISWEQLAYYLKLQDLLQLPSTHQNRLGRQMIELGLASRAEIEVAELDCETTGCSMYHAITRRGWVKQELLATLTYTMEKGKSGETAKPPAASSSKLLTGKPAASKLISV